MQPLAAVSDTWLLRPAAGRGIGVPPMLLPLTKVGRIGPIRRLSSCNPIHLLVI
jgi:hypothetical protein